MGTRTDKFEFFIRENEQIDAIIKVYEEKNSVIYGLVVDCNDNPIKDAVVKLFEKIITPKDIKLIPLTHTFTDSCGNFLFGPLCPNKKYVLKVWYNNVSIRNIVFDIDDCDNKCDYDPESDNHHHECDCNPENHSYDHECDYNHESHSHDHNCVCDYGSHSHHYEREDNHKNINYLEELQKKLQMLCNPNTKDDDDDSDLPMKKPKERNHRHRSRHYHKGNRSDY